MKKKEAKKPVTQKPIMDIVAPTPVQSEDLEIRFLNARVEIHKLEEEREQLFKRVAAEGLKVYELREAERIRMEKRNAAWRFAGHLLLLCLFSFGCAMSAAACVSYGPWWTAIAPALLLLAGLKEALKS